MCPVSHTWLARAWKSVWARCRPPGWWGQARESVPGTRGPPNHIFISAKQSPLSFLHTLSQPSSFSGSHFLALFPLFFCVSLPRSCPSWLLACSHYLYLSFDRYSYIIFSFLNSHPLCHYPICLLCHYQITSTVQQTISQDFLPVRHFHCDWCQNIWSCPDCLQDSKTLATTYCSLFPFLPEISISFNLFHTQNDTNQSVFKVAHATEIVLVAVTYKLHATRPAKLSLVLVLLDLSVALHMVSPTTVHLYNACK